MNEGIFNPIVPPSGFQQDLYPSVDSIPSVDPSANSLEPSAPGVSFGFGALSPLMRLNRKILQAQSAKKAEQESLDGDAMSIVMQDYQRSMKRQDEIHAKLEAAILQMAAPPPERDMAQFSGQEIMATALASLFGVNPNDALNTVARQANERNDREYESEVSAYNARQGANQATINMLGAEFSAANQDANSLRNMAIQLKEGDERERVRKDERAEDIKHRGEQFQESIRQFGVQVSSMEEKDALNALGKAKTKGEVETAIKRLQIAVPPEKFALLFPNGDLSGAYDGAFRNARNDYDNDIFRLKSMGVPIKGTTADFLERQRQMIIREFGKENDPGPAPSEETLKELEFTEGKKQWLKEFSQKEAHFQKEHGLAVSRLGLDREKFNDAKAEWRAKLETDPKGAVGKKREAIGEIDDQLQKVRSELAKSNGKLAGATLKQKREITAEIKGLEALQRDLRAQKSELVGTPTLEAPAAAQGGSREIATARIPGVGNVTIRR